MISIVSWLFSNEQFLELTFSRFPPYCNKKKIAGFVCNYDNLATPRPIYWKISLFTCRAYRQLGDRNGPHCREEATRTGAPRG